MDCVAGGIYYGARGMTHIILIMLIMWIGHTAIMCVIWRDIVDGIRCVLDSLERMEGGQ